MCPMSKSTTQKSFKELYQEELHKPTPANAWIERVAKVSRRSPMTVRMWLNGKQYPDDLAREVIAKELGVDAKALFPVN